MKIIKWIDLHFEEVLLSIFLVVLTLSTGAQVVMRYVFSSSLAWSEELSRFCFLLSAYFSLGYCLRNRSEIKLDLLVSFIPPKARIGVDILGRVVEILLFYYLCVGARKMISDAVFTNQTSPAMVIPMYYVHFLCYVGLVIGIIRAVQRIVLDVLLLIKKDVKEGGATE